MAARYPKNNYHQSNMTLIEKLTVAFIIGILSAIAVPTWSGFVSAQEVKVTGNEIQLGLASAKSEARLKKFQLPSQLLEPARVYPLSFARKIDPAIAIPFSSQISISQSVEHSFPNVKSGLIAQTVASVSSPNSTISHRSSSLVPCASAHQKPRRRHASSSQPSLAPQGGRGGTDVSDYTEVSNRGAGYHPLTGSKKAKTQKIKFIGCFQSNGVFQQKTGSNWQIVNIESTPAGATITLTGTRCSEVPST